MAIFAAGGVVCSRADDGLPRILLIHDRHGAWTLPKGRLKTGESEEDAARREILEETGIDCVLGPLLERVSYSVEKKGRWQTKYVAYFYATARFTPPVARAAEGISDASWLLPQEAIGFLSYPAFVPFIHKAVELFESQ